MMNRISDERALKNLVVAGIVPAIRRELDMLEQSEKTTYDALFMIGEYVNTYHEVFCTGNKVEVKK